MEKVNAMAEQTKVCKSCYKEIDRRARVCPFCRKPQRPGCVTLGCGGLALLFILAIAIPNCLRSRERNDPAPASAPAPMAEPAPPPEAEPAPPEPEPLERKVKAELVGWRKGGFGKVGFAKFLIINDNDFPIKDIALELHYYAPSGTELKKDLYIIFDVVDANSQRHFDEVSVGFIPEQAQRMGVNFITALKKE